MYLRTTKRINKNGTIAEYYQLAHNKIDPATKKNTAHIIHNFGRSDKLDRDELVRLCRSIARVCDLTVTDPLEKSNDIIESEKGVDFEAQENENGLIEGSEEILAEAQKISQFGNWVLDISNNTFFWSKETYRIFGLEIGATPEDFWGTGHPDDRAQQIKAVNDAYHKHIPYNIDHRIIRPDGTERLLNEQAEVISDEEGKLIRIVGTVQDITERKKAEKTLKERSDYLEKTVQEHTKDLEEMNTTLRVLVKGRDEEKLELEEKMLSNIVNLVSPYLEKLKTTGLNDRQKEYMHILESNLEDIISPFSNKLSGKHFNFTPMEVKVANLVKQGKTTKEMADLLYISISTVDFYRKSIRKKLGLKKLKTNLRTFLLSNL